MIVPTESENGGGLLKIQTLTSCYVRRILKPFSWTFFTWLKDQPSLEKGNFIFGKDYKSKMYGMTFH